MWARKHPENFGKVSGGENPLAGIYFRPTSFFSLANLEKKEIKKPPFGGSLIF
jgi:hypothetical protein